MKFVIDMNLSPRWADYLGARGMGAVHWSSIGPSDASDVTIMTHAAQQARVVLTHDLDFGAILAANRARNPVSCKFAPMTSGQERSAIIWFAL